MLSRKRFLNDLTNLLTIVLLIAGAANVARGQASRPAVQEQTAAAEPAASSGASQEIAAAKVDATAKPAIEKSDPPTPTATPTPAPCQRIVNADVVAMPQPIMLNRLGAAIPDGLIFALKSDTVATVSGGNTTYQLKTNKRARPLVLRANVGDCLKIRLTNGIPTNKFTDTTPGLGASTG